MERERRDWIAIVLAAAGVVGAISLAGIFIVYLVDTIGDDGNSKPTSAARAFGTRTVPKTPLGSTGGQDDGKSSSAAGKKSGGASKGGASGATGSAGATQNKIPDGQKYTTFTNRSGGYSILVPEGWTKQEATKAVRFSLGANFVTINSGKGPRPTVKSVSAKLGANKNVKIIKKPRDVTVGGHRAVVTTLEGKKSKKPLVLTQYKFGKRKKIVTVLLATAGKFSKDNADDYRRIASSFRWL
jgi:hypothetical protein